ncbi:MAG TPA: TolC family protein, partial [Longimicrobiales bacterium]|nr:TolC family protein [Longimicrobiales bacterium]
MKRNCRVAVAAIALWIPLPVAAAAQQTPVRGARSLTLEEALSLAQESSEPVTIARSDIQRARGEQFQARSEYLPQVLGSASYTRTLKSEFSGLGSDDDGGTPSEPCLDFNPNRLAPLSERVDSLESALACRDQESPFGDIFGDLPFGREHQYNLGLSVSQTVFAGGRLRAQSRIASANRRVAESGMTSTQAQLVLTVTEAYYNAVLSDRLFTIADATMVQTETTLSQVKVA